MPGDLHLPKEHQEQQDSKIVWDTWITNGWSNCADFGI
jgi:hypothetical protein